VTPVPFKGPFGQTVGVEAEGRDVRDDEMPLAMRFSISPAGFKLLGMHLVQGREFTDADRAGAKLVCAISQSLARRLFGDEPAVGRRVRITGDRRMTVLEVVATVGDIKNSLFRETPPQIYFAFLQFPSATISMVARVNVEPNSLAAAARREVYAVDAEQPVRDVGSMDSLIAETTHDRRFTMILLTLFSGLAFTLAAVGIYAVVAYTVAQRTTEIGIRMALGASTTNVLKMVMRHGMTVVAIGIALGLAGTLALARVIDSMLYQIAPHDPLTLCTITLLLTGVAALACWRPARRATKVDPIVALRAE
jgi:putative ABC transport system permease protein